MGRYGADLTFLRPFFTFRTTDGAYRNGLSVISARNLLVVGCRFLRTAGTAPEAGIDIEPNTPKLISGPPNFLANVTFIDTECRRNRGTGLAFALGKVGQNVSVDISVTGMVIEGCSDGCPSTEVPGTGDPNTLLFNVGLMFADKVELGPAGTSGTISLTNVTVTATAQPGLETENKRPGGALVTMTRCIIDSVATSPSIRWGGPNVPILLHESRCCKSGGFVFDGLVVRDVVKRPWLKCDSCATRGPVTGVHGSVQVFNPEGCSTDLGPGDTNVSIAVDCNTSRPVPPRPAPPLQMVVPLYVDPGPVWTRLAKSAVANRAVDIIAIISPDHGDNDATMAGGNIPRYLAHNKSWLDGMAMLRRAGVKINHYMHLRNLTCSKRVNSGCSSSECCVTPDGAVVNKNRCCNDIANISEIVDAVNTYFPDDGIFTDNGPFAAPSPDSSVNTVEKLRSFEQQAFAITQKGVGSGGRLVISNGHFDTWALANLNESIMFESSIVQVRPLPPLARGMYPRSRFTALICGVQDTVAMRQTVDRFLDAGYGGVCLLQTQENPHVYDNLPPYWEEQVAYLASKSLAAMPVVGPRAGAAHRDQGDAATAPPPPLPAPSSRLPAVTTRHIQADGVNRSYEIQVPATPPNTTVGYPVIISFHGDHGHADGQAASDGLRLVGGTVAIIVHPQGIGTELATGKEHPTWNGGGSSMQGIGPNATGMAPDGETCVATTRGTCFVSCAAEPGRNCRSDPCWWSNCGDDVAFVLALLADLEQAYAVDTDRVFLTGDSNGAMFLYTIIADPRIAGKIAAVAPVSGLPHNGFLFPPVSPTLRYLNFWGTNDDYVVAECNVPGRPDKSFSSKYGWFYSCLTNTTETLARALSSPDQEYRQLPIPALLSAPSGARCHGWASPGTVTAVDATVAHCSFAGPHGWPPDDGSPRWASRLIVSFFLGRDFPAPP